MHASAARLPLALSVAAVLFAGSAPVAAELVVLRPGPEGEDVAPYEFIPSSLRGNNPNLWAVTAESEGQGHDFVTYLRFELPADLVGPDEEVAEALLTVVYTVDEVIFGEGSDDPGVLECRPVTEDWSEASVTWSTRPGSGEPVDVITGIESLGPLAFDVTELVADWVDGVQPNHGFALTNPTERLMGFFAFEASVDPVFKASLEIDVRPVPEPAAGTGAAAAALAALARRRKRRAGR
jgi:hypothetical protein